MGMIITFLLLFNSSILNEATESAISQIRSLSVAKISDELEKNLLTIEKIANINLLTNDQISNEEKIELIATFKEDNDYSDIGIASLDGILISTNQTDGLSVKDRDYFQSALTGKTVLHGPLISRTDGKSIIVFATPIRDEDQIVGVLVALYRTEILTAIIQDVRLYNNGSVFISNSEGTIIASQHDNDIGSKLDDVYTQKLVDKKDYPSLETSVKLKLTDYHLFMHENREVFVGYQPIPNTDWSIGLVVEKIDMLNYLNKFRYLLYIVIAIGFISLLALISYLRFMITRVDKYKLKSENAIDTAKIMVILTDFNLSILEINHHAKSILGNKNESDGSGSLRDYLDYTNQKELDSVIKYIKEYDYPPKLELKLSLATSEVIYMQFYITLMEGDKLEFMGVDVSEIILSQKELAAKHEELTSLYEELTTSEEEIRHNFEELNRYSQEIEHIAYSDSLTDLPNRKKLQENLNEIVLSSKDDVKYAIYLVDLDRFKYLNDNLGHHIGDVVLVTLAARFTKEIINQDTTVFRVSGDEFIIIERLPQNQEFTLTLASKVLQLVREPMFISANHLSVTACIGITVFPFDSQNVIQLLKNADIAMYEAKRTGNSVVIYEPEMGIALASKLNMEEDLKQALKNNELEVYYQPQLDLKSGKLSGFEALLRWHSPKRGFVPPDIFIPLAEERGLINVIGDWVMEEACCFLSELNRKFNTDLDISINISSIQLFEVDFTDKVKAIIKKTDITSTNLTIELTESVMITGFEENLRKIKELIDVGVKFSLDDFGEGYSSFNYLRKLPVHFMKIDKSFIRDMSHNNNEHLIESIIQLGHHLSMKVVAEGVETKEQLLILERIACDQVQGYYYSYPMPKEEAFLFVQNTTTE